MKNDFLNFFGKVSGRVQGVGYRTWTKKTAEYYGLYGWVKNCHDGSVELEVFGAKEKVNKFLKKCYKGPILSKVEKIDILKKKYKEYHNFEIVY